MNKPQINVYLTFNGNCREAMEFYQSCLGGELFIQNFADTPMANEMPEEARQAVLHASLTSGNLVLLASDAGGQYGHVTAGTNMALSLDCSNAEEANAFFAKLSAGGNVTMPLVDMFWGALFGMFTDQFGMSWLVNFDKKAAQ